MLSSAKSESELRSSLLLGCVAIDLQAKVFSELTFNQKPCRTHKISKSPGNGVAMFSAEEQRGLWHPDNEGASGCCLLGAMGLSYRPRAARKLGVFPDCSFKDPLPRTRCGVLILSSGVAGVLVVIMVPHVLGGNSD